MQQNAKALGANMEFWESMEDFVNRDRAVDRERYEEARGLREEVLKILGGLRGRFSRRRRSGRRGPGRTRLELICFDYCDKIPCVIRVTAQVVEA